MRGFEKYSDLQRVRRMKALAQKRTSLMPVAVAVAGAALAMAVALSIMSSRAAVIGL